MTATPKWYLLAAILAASLVAIACGRSAAPDRFHGPTMGTTYSIEVTRRPEGVGRDQLQTAIDQVLAEINQHLSTYDPASEISKFNAAATTEPVEVSEVLSSVAGIAHEVSSASGGAFDITVGPLVRAWGFGTAAAGTTTVPDLATLASIRVAVGYDKLQSLSGRRALRKTVPGLQLDVNGIAPGYAVDRIAERFDAFGVNDYLIELGGEVRGRGRSPAGRPWRVAVEAPLSGERRPYTLVELDAMAVSTSGDYRDFHIVDGRRVSHTIDPRTGATVKHRLVSVTVVHQSAAYADAYATALMVLGPEEGLALANQLGLAALFIEHSADGKSFVEHATGQFQRLRRPLD